MDRTDIEECINHWCYIKFKNGCVEVGKLVDSPNGLLYKTFGNCGSGKFKINFDKVESIELDDYMEELMEQI